MEMEVSNDSFILTLNKYDFADLSTQRCCKKSLINLPIRIAETAILLILFSCLLCFPEDATAVDSHESLIFKSTIQESNKKFPYLLAANSPRQYPKRVKRKKALTHIRIGHAVPWANMTRAQRSAFQHSYSRHGVELGLPMWKQRNAAVLQKQFNAVVSHIRKTSTYIGIKRKPVDGKSTKVKYFESIIQGTKYYYYETLGGKFVSAGKAHSR